MRKLVNRENIKETMQHLNFILMIVFMLTFFIILLLLSQNTHATDVGGHITQDTTWNASGNPYIVTEHIIIDEEVILTINPGVNIKFHKNLYLRVDGRLDAIGNEFKSRRRKITIKKKKAKLKFPRSYVRLVRRKSSKYTSTI